GSRWDQSGYLSIAKQASLTISDGGHVTNTQGVTSGTVNVSGAGSVWDQSSALTMNGGSLTIANGGVVNAASSLIDFGSVTISGPGSTWLNNGNIEVGVTGGGSVIISDGAHLSNSSAQLGTRLTGTGSVRVIGPGSPWTNSGDVIVGSGSSSTIGAVVLSQGGAVSVDGGLLIQTYGFLNGD